MGRFLKMEDEALCGRLVFERQGGTTTCTTMYAKYPIKFMEPRGMVSKGKNAAALYMLGYGGGLVAGDDIRVSCCIGEGCNVLLTTQTTTKVYKCDEGDSECRQGLRVKIDADGLLVLAPDPVTCFFKARYVQNQYFNLETSSNLLLIDWVTGGRKRMQSIPCNSANVGSKELNEEWVFEEYESYNEIMIDKMPILLDRQKLRDDERVSIKNRIGGAHVFGLVVVIGSKLKNIQEMIMLQSKRLQLRDDQAPVPQGRISSRSVLPGIMSSASRLSEKNGVIVRFCADSTENAYRYVMSLTEPLTEIFGHQLYQQTR